MTKTRPKEGRRDLVQLIQNAIAKHGRGGQTAVARGIGLSVGRLGRILSGENALSELTCLRFSKFSGEPPSRVLRAAGPRQAEVADLIEKLYAVGDSSSSPTEREVLALYRKLTPKAQSTVRELLEALSSAPARTARGISS